MHHWQVKHKPDPFLICGEFRELVELVICNACSDALVIVFEEPGFFMVFQDKPGAPEIKK